jgi:tetraacyldisaccharide 4'-kinase
VIDQIWYGNSVVRWLLVPLSWLFRGLVSVRSAWYRLGLGQINQLPVPVIIVGNINVGGTGKTPVVIWLAARLKAAGWRPGIVSRGYKGAANTWPQHVRGDSDPEWVGDEPVLLARRSGCPVAVGPDRVAAATLILDHCNVLIADDGLQHYALGRDFEIAVIDGERGLGNRMCLPAGPLREPVQRLKTVDAVILNGGDFQPVNVRGIRGNLVAESACRLVTGETRRLDAFRSTPVHAVAGIGNPRRFFRTLEQFGLEVIAHPLADHAKIDSSQFAFGDDQAVLMTEKDAVKALSIGAAENWWSVPVDFELAEPDTRRLMYAIEAVIGQPAFRG